MPLLNERSILTENNKMVIYNFSDKRAFISKYNSFSLIELFRVSTVIEKYP